MKGDAILKLKNHPCNIIPCNGNINSNNTEEIQAEKNNYSLLEEDNNTIEIEHKLKNILHTKFCCVCIENNEELSLIYDNFEYVILGNVCIKSMKKILYDIFSDDQHIPASSYICKQCTDRILETHLYIQTLKESAKLINNYINSFYSKTIQLEDQLDPNNDYSNTKCIIIVENNGDDYNSTDLLRNNSSENKYFKQIIEKDSTLTLDSSTKEVYGDVIEESTVKSCTDEIMVTENRIQAIRTEHNAYRCSECNVVLLNFKKWKEHENYFHKNPQPVTCKICYKNFGSNKTLIAHYKNHNQVRCNLCCKIIPDKAFQRHLKLRHDSCVYACDYCGLVFYTEAALETHIKSNHIVIASNIGNGNEQCIMCFKYFVKGQLINHPCRFSCNDCTEIPCIHYKYLISYRKQKLNHVRNVKCLDCDYICCSKELLMEHVNRYHLNHLYACKFCERQYFSKITLNSHILRMHQDFTCNFCSENFKDEFIYNDHVCVCKYNKNYLEAFYTTDPLHKPEKLNSNNEFNKLPIMESVICNEEIDFKEEYICHMNTYSKSYNRKCDIDMYDEKSTESHISELEKLPCKVCGKLVKPISMYSHIRCHRMKVDPIFKKKHQSSLNVAKRNFKCNYCGHAAFTKPYLESHINRYHLKIKPYKCQVCKVGFSCKYQMTEHKKIHSENSRYTCSVCGKKLLHKVTLKKHMMMHTGERPHVCDICGEGFITTNMLNEHRFKHKGKSVECPLCKNMFYFIKDCRHHIKQCHWKYKDKPFDFKQVNGLRPEHYYIFQDRRYADAVKLKNL